MSGVAAWGSYLPVWRLARGEVQAAVGGPGGTGHRAVAGYDEDTTSMGVAAGQAALAMDAAGAGAPDRLLFATADPAYAEKANATTVHAALALDRGVAAYDVGGSVRSGVGAVRAALERAGTTLVVTSDRRGGLPGSADEVGGGDGASAVLIADGPGVAEYLGGASVTAEFLDRWRLPGETGTRTWEERFGAAAYRPLGEQAVTDALKSAGLTADRVDTWLVTGTHPRAARGLAGAVARAGGAVGDDLTVDVGDTGTAHPLLLLAAALERAAPDQVVALVVLADGADVLLFRTTPAVGAARPQPTVAEQAATGAAVRYPTFLTWRGLLDREPPRRPEPERPSAPAAHRAGAWKYGFHGSRCVACGTRHLPPQRVCVRCGATDRMRPESLATLPGRVTTFTVDRLAYSLSPPVVVAVVDFDGGGRYTCELTDVDAETVAVGDRVEMTFRCLYTADGVRNYFWKARPAHTAATGGQ